MLRRTCILGLRLDEHTVDQLDSLAKETGLKASVLARLAITHFIADSRRRGALELLVSRHWVGNTAPETGAYYQAPSQEAAHDESGDYGSPASQQQAQVAYAAEYEAPPTGNAEAGLAKAGGSDDSAAGADVGATEEAAESPSEARECAACDIGAEAFSCAEYANADASPPPPLIAMNRMARR